MQAGSWKTALRRIAKLFCVSALCLIAVTLQAQETTFELDPEKTTVEFTLGDILHTVHGTFKAKSGNLRLDPASGLVSGAFVIDATSGQSGNKTRDRKMHNEILESAQYPEVRFTPNKITGAIAPQGSSTIQVQGVFTLHGSDHDITLSVPVKVTGNEAVANINFQVPYVAWGLKNPSTFLLRVSKEVEISITATGRFVPGRTP